MDVLRRVTLGLCKRIRSVLQLLVTANVVPSSLFPSTLMMEALRSSATSVYTRPKLRSIAQDDILHSHRLENLKSCMAIDLLVQMQVLTTPIFQFEFLSVVTLGISLNQRYLARGTRKHLTGCAELKEIVLFMQHFMYCICRSCTLYGLTYTPAVFGSTEMTRNYICGWAINTCCLLLFSTQVGI
jgi:hypothetical protein